MMKFVNNVKINNIVLISIQSLVIPRINPKLSIHKKLQSISRASFIVFSTAQRHNRL